MTDSTTTNKNILKKAGGILLSVIFWLAVWQAASMLIANELKLFLPAPGAVFGRLAGLLCTAGFYKNAGSTLLRIFCGFVLGSALGLAFGIFTFASKAARTVFAPAMRVIRAVPVVSFIILAFLFIKVDRLPVFISMLMVMPTVWQSVHDGLCGTDRQLTEMCRVYKVGKVRELFAVRLPLSGPEVVTAAVNALGLAWKSGVAAEVLCTPVVSIGYGLSRAKGNLDFEGVYAMTLTVVVLSVLFEIVLKLLCRHFITGGNENAEA